MQAVRKHSQAGKPAAGVVPAIVGYQLHYKIPQDSAKLAVGYRSKGRFILATNQLSTTALPDPLILEEYKSQTQVEHGFRFIKDNSFAVSSVY